VFVETKIWISDYGYEQTLHGFEKSARKLGVDEIDLLILHQALPSKFESSLEAYRVLETLLVADLIVAGKVGYFGLSEAGADTIRRAPAVQPVAAVQSEYSIWARDPEAEVLPACTDLGTGFLRGHRWDRASSPGPSSLRFVRRQRHPQPVPPVHPPKPSPRTSRSSTS
jgi:aryl-alcohol dehydrogenase-like predicted oxidoreductase